MKKIKRKAVNFELIPLDNQEPYHLLDEAREKWHDDLQQARIALAWRLRLKADHDGHLLLGKCVKVSDLQKEFADFDFIVVLNREVWNSPEFTRAKQLALLDHELCHATVAEDEETGDPKYDERGRPVFRVRKHDIEEFRGVVARHGTYKRDLEEFARVLLRKQDTPLLNQSEPEEEAVAAPGMSDAELEAYFREAVKGSPETIMWPEGVGAERCEAMLAKVQGESSVQ